MAKDKLKMSNKRFMAIMIPVIVFLVAAMITVTCVMNYFGLVMDKVFGQGARHIVNVEGTETWDTQYYDVKYDTSDEALKAASDKSKEVCDEGYVLLKNAQKNGKNMLPLAEKSKITPFGFPYTAFSDRVPFMMRWDTAILGLIIPRIIVQINIP